MAGNQSEPEQKTLNKQKSVLADMGGRRRRRMTPSGAYSDYTQSLAKQHNNHALREAAHLMPAVGCMILAHYSNQRVWRKFLPLRTLPTPQPSEAAKRELERCVNPEWDRATRCIWGRYATSIEFFLSSCSPCVHGRLQQ